MVAHSYPKMLAKYVKYMLPGLSRVFVEVLPTFQQTAVVTSSYNISRNVGTISTNDAAKTRNPTFCFIMYYALV
jgi:hypothetical protein